MRHEALKALLLNEISDLAVNQSPLTLADVPDPVPGGGEILIRISACGVCRTELDEIEGRTPPPRFPVVPGHQVVGRVESAGAGASKWKPGDRVGVGWIFSACGSCRFCLSGRENLCPDFQATGRDSDGGYTEYMTIREDFAYPIPDVYSDSEAAPLLCAGAVGYRSLRLTGIRDGDKLGFTGFGASAHLVLQLARFQFPRTECFVFARSEKERAFALELGAAWAGDPGEEAPETLDAIIDTTPAWRPVLGALRNLAPGGRLVINAIRKEDGDRDALKAIDYSRDLWMEKEIKSVANVTRHDVSEFLRIAGRIPIRPEFQEFPLEDANRVLADIKAGRIRGAKVLRI